MDETSIVNCGSKPAADAETNEYKVRDSSDAQDMHSSPPSQPIACKTCDSTQDCQQDPDNPGDFYCKCCREEYAAQSQQMHGQVANDKLEMGVSNEPINNGVNGAVQPMATQSPSESDAMQTQALSMTQPQTQAMTQPPESQHHQQSQMDVDEQKVPSSQNIEEAVEEDGGVEKEPAGDKTGGNVEGTSPIVTSYADVHNGDSVSESCTDENSHTKDESPQKTALSTEAEGVDLLAQ